jgi:hypothetical protein
MHVYFFLEALNFIVSAADYGRQRKLFSLKSRTFGLGEKNWADKFWGIWGIFGRTISTHFCTVSPLSMFSIIQALFIQKTKPLNPHPKYAFWDWDLNLGRKELGISPSCVRSPWCQPHLATMFHLSVPHSNPKSLTYLAENSLLVDLFCHTAGIKYLNTPHRFWYFFSIYWLSKGQEISEWKYGVVPLPKIWTKNLKNSALNT